MTYTISVEPSRTPGKLTATSSDGHSRTTSTPYERRGPGCRTVTIERDDGSMKRIKRCD